MSSLEFNGPSDAFIDVQRKDIGTCVGADHIEIEARAYQFVGVDAGHKESRLTDQRSGKDVSERADNNAASSNEWAITVPTWHLYA